MIAMSIANGTGGFHLLVRAKNAQSRHGIVAFGPFRFPCALGRGGVTSMKREGDGAAPRGRFRLARVYYNPLHVPRPRTGLPISVLRRDDGWCNGIGDRNSNRPVRHPYPASAERLWRDDGLYDLVVVIDCNLRPRVQGRGSAIFMHIATPELRPTEGCIALSRPHLTRLIERLRPATRITIGRQ